MRPALAQLWVVVVMAGCFRPSPPEGAPCSSQGECPSGLVCDRGLCVRTPLEPDGADPIDAPTDAGLDGAIDAPPDAAMGMVVFGAGTHPFVVPEGCAQLRVRVWGGGGGGGGDGSGTTPGSDGGNSVCSTIRGNGGRGGASGNPAGTFQGGNGGSAFGQIDERGEDGGDGSPVNIVGPSGAGGGSPMGGSGGPSVTTPMTDGNPGMPPGGGGSGGQSLHSPAAGGGGGGYAEGTLAVIPGQELTIVVGEGGAGGGGTAKGGAGADGRIILECE